LVEKAYSNPEDIIKALRPQISLVDIQRYIYITISKILKLYPKFFVGEGSTLNWIGRGLRRILIAALLKQPLDQDIEDRMSNYAIITISSYPFKRWKKAFPKVFENITEKESLIADLSSFKKRDFKLSCQFMKQRARLGDYLALIIKTASDQLLRLGEEKNLPMFCPLHEKVFWSRCPLCSEVEKGPETSEIHSEEIFEDISEDIPLPKTNDEELYSALLKELEDRADNFQIKLKNEEKIELHWEILKQKGSEKNETAQEKEDS